MSVPGRDWQWGERPPSAEWFDARDRVAAELDRFVDAVKREGGLTWKIAHLAPYLDCANSITDAFVPRHPKKP